MSTVEEINAKLDEVKTVVTNVAGDVDSLQSQVAALKEQLNAGTPATQADLDALSEKISSIKESLGAVDAKEPAAG